MYSTPRYYYSCFMRSRHAEITTKTRYLVHLGINRSASCTHRLPLSLCCALRSSLLVLWYAPQMCGEEGASDTHCLDVCSGYEALIPDVDDFTYRYYTVRF